MKIAIVNDIHMGPALEIKGNLRAHSHLMEESLPKLLKYIQEAHAPDLIVNLGDLIRSVGLEEDRLRYRKALGAFQNLDPAVLHVLGNHEIKKMHLQEVEAMWREAGFHQKSYGIKECGSIAIIWIGLAYENGTKNLFLPQDQLLWLQKTVKALDKPAIVFSHCTLDAHDVRGNFFFEVERPTESSIFFLKNQKAVCQILTESPWIKAVFQAHLHYFHFVNVEGLPHVTCPAMGDNVCAPSMQENNPEVYTLLFVEKEKLIVKAYSRQFCFAGTEFKMR